NVVITGRNAENVSKVSKQCSDVSPKRLKPLEVVADVTKEEDLHRTLDTTIKTFGKLDILVNNAGFGNLSLVSLLYVKVSPEYVHRMAAELGPKHIRVNSVNPGVVRTEFFKDLSLADEQFMAMLYSIVTKYPVGRCGQSMDIANAVAYLASDQASFITGLILLADGGHIAANVALITGSSSGIGAATAVLLAKSGANVVITGRNAENVSKVSKQCSDVSPKHLKPLEVVADVTKEEDLHRLLDTTIKTFGKLDILVNNAGFAIRAEITDSDFIQKYKSVLETNVDSVVYLTHISVKHLEKTKGNIINISSIAGIQAGHSMSPYCMSKTALDMFTKCMAAELGPKHIRVNSVKLYHKLVL
ncbi:unnamed protein product, partial [Oppiella nova]